MEIYNALQLKNGKKSDYTRLFSVSQPLQFIPKSEKDDDWTAWNMDWLEWQGLKQIKSNARRLIKNYKLAEGIIDKSDYIVEDNNEMKDIVDQLSTNSEMEALELKFYPIIPNVIKTLVGEFAKRDTSVTFRAVDEETHNEILNRKKEDIEDILVRNATNRILDDMINEGLDLENPQVQEMLKQRTSPEAIKSLPDIQEFYSKSYQVLSEKWAAKQQIVDEERFTMDELEQTAFKDLLITDREFWHFLMFEDDYKVELWNPATTFYHKSPKERYISNAHFVGNIEIMTPADVIDNYGWKMNEDQLLSLQDRFLTHTPGYNIGGLQNDGSFYDANKSHDWNVNRPSLEYRQLLAGANFTNNNNDIIGWILNESEDNHFFSKSNMLRVTTGYWKSQMKVGHLTKVSENGQVETGIITEDYKVTDKPIYNTSLFKNKTRDNLVFGEHIDWVWINQTWGGIKIGPNAPTMYGTDNVLGIKPIYLGINGNKIKPLKFQFKGDNTIYGCKLPVEGRVFSDRNVKSKSLVDSMKPFQIGYNIVNNQISDILIDEIGTVILLDQNALPKHSMGEDWGEHNLAKAYVAMKDFSMLPLDTSITNTENALNFSHFQQLDLSQTQRLLSRIQLASYFKAQAFEQMGLTPQRMGQAIGSKTSATEVEQMQVGSYAQTEMYFVEHCDHLMPRVHKMRTDLAQWYNSTKPSVILQTTTALDERINFQINGVDLLLSDLRVYATTKANYRRILEEIKNFAKNNNTGGTTIYDLALISQSESLGAINSALKLIDQKVANQKAEERAHEEKLLRMQLDQAEKEKMMEKDYESRENEKRDRKDILVAEIRASSFGATQDINQNQESDFVDAMDKVHQSQMYQDTASIQREKMSANREQHLDKMNLKREDMNLKRETNATNLQIAKENKNKYDVLFKPRKNDNTKKKKK